MPDQLVARRDIGPGDYRLAGLLYNLERPDLVAAAEMDFRAAGLGRVAPVEIYLQFALPLDDGLGGDAEPKGNVALVRLPRSIRSRFHHDLAPGAFSRHVGLGEGQLRDEERLRQLQGGRSLPALEAERGPPVASAHIRRRFHAQDALSAENLRSRAQLVPILPVGQHGPDGGSLYADRSLTTLRADAQRAGIELDRSGRSGRGGRLLVTASDQKQSGSNQGQHSHYHLFNQITNVFFYSGFSLSGICFCRQRSEIVITAPAGKRPKSKTSRMLSVPSKSMRSASSKVTVAPAATSTLPL